MKKQLHILEGLLILTFIFIAGLLTIKFISYVNHEEVDTNYMWDIHFKNLQIEEGSKNATISLEEDVLKLNVILDKEEEYYAFYLDIENSGTLDAELDTIDFLVNNKKEILTYKLSYVDGREIKKGDVLVSNTKEKIMVRIEYPKQENKIYEALALDLSLQMHYIPVYK